ncbi:YciI family protein [Terriglobus tenax]|uniref:hypothetical protein n=1 Tax=Terriglobus tenax TaxID=1111115 RepID=UPI0021E0580E|nr:hypothetical protein [Terriglobus tenax]
MRKLAVLVLLFASYAALHAQTAVKPTCVLVNLTAKPGMREKMGPVMQQEVTDTVQAYLDGKILQWFSRADGTGVMFILNATSVDDAKAIMGALPLDKAGLVNLEFTPLAPLQPLKRLLGAQK